MFLLYETEERRQLTGTNEMVKVTWLSISRVSDLFRIIRAVFGNAAQESYIDW